MSAKEELHHLLDDLPESEVPAARRFLEFLCERGDPFLQVLRDAPEDDEPETPEEADAVREATDESLNGQTRPWREVRKDLAGD